MLNDAGWFLFLFTWPIFSVWFVTIAVGVLCDKSAKPVFPRWAAYLNFWTAFIFVPAGLMIFFKRGPFGYNGLISLYIATGCFFIWVIVMSWLTMKSINAEKTSEVPLAGRDTAQSPLAAAQHRTPIAAG